jgi:hypothetical protein
MFRARNIGSAYDRMHDHGAVNIANRRPPQDLIYPIDAEWAQKTLSANYNIGRTTARAVRLISRQCYSRPGEEEPLNPKPNELCLMVHLVC